jgi:hypothetical protein
MADEEEPKFVGKTIGQWEVEGKRTIEAEGAVSGPDYTWENFFKNATIAELGALDFVLRTEITNISAEANRRVEHISRIRRAIRAASASTNTDPPRR